MLARSYSNAGLRQDERRRGLHTDRHLFGTLTLEAGIPMEIIAKMMGHSSISCTQIYTQITDQKISMDIDRIITDCKVQYANAHKRG